MGHPLADRLTLALDRLLAGRAREVPALAAPLPPRPDAPFVWLHGQDAAAARALDAVAVRIAQDLKGHRSLVTPSALHPGPGAAGAGRFLDQLRPDAAVLAGPAFQPEVLGALHSRRIPVLGAMLRAPQGHWLEHPLVRPLAHRQLAGFAALLAEDVASLAALRRLGAPAGRLMLGGVLAAPVPVPKGSPTEQQSLTGLMRGRPLWCAASLPLGELPVVAEAQRLALARSHRLLLVIVPERLEEAPAMRQGLAAAGLVSGLRSAGEDPVDDLPVYLADLEGELGLWLRLAPASFQGGTLTAGAPSRSPMEAAALGSAILHGPESAPHASDYARLAAVGAARLTPDAATLAAEVDRLMSPDQAAEMALAAWQIASAGDEAAGAVVAQLRLVLEGTRA